MKTKKKTAHLLFKTECLAKTFLSSQRSAIYFIVVSQ